MMKNLITLNTPAKVNLHLRILNRYENGYHELETIFLPVALFDDLKIERRTDGKISLDVLNADLPADESNLCSKAAAAFAASVPEFEGCSIQLKKRIPVGAGLGGGSSDCAAVLTGLNVLYENPLDRKKLVKLAVQLGADVPFFLRPAPAIGRGIGELLEYVPVSWELWFLLVCPEVKISTAWAFSEYKIGLTKEKKNIILNSQFLRDVQVDVFYEIFENDFESLIFSYYPRLGEIKQRLYYEGALFAGLSGTGSTIFGLFRDKEAADRAETMFKDEMDTFVIRLLNTHGK